MPNSNGNHWHGMTLQTVLGCNLVFILRWGSPMHRFSFHIIAVSFYCWIKWDGTTWNGEAVALNPVVFFFFNEKQQSGFISWNFNLLTMFWLFKIIFQSNRQHIFVIHTETMKKKITTVSNRLMNIMPIPFFTAMWHLCHLLLGRFRGKLMIWCKDMLFYIWFFYTHGLIIFTVTCRGATINWLIDNKLIIKFINSYRDNRLIV